MTNKHRYSTGTCGGSYCNLHWWSFSMTNGHRYSTGTGGGGGSIYIHIYNLQLYVNAYIYIECIGRSIGYRNLYCWPLYLAGSGPCGRPRVFENRLLNDVLVNFGRSLTPLILEQTPTALLVDGQRDSFETVPNRSSTSPHAFFDKGRPRLGGLHSAPWNT